jgi:PhzF family phenazine biosynthesis protein
VGVSEDILRYAAFSDRPESGNPAGVVLDASDISDERMLAIAAEVGYSETAFVIARDGKAYDIRYFSPLAEVPFCGHATVATAVALAERDGDGELLFRTRSGPVPVSTARTTNGLISATLTSVPPSVADVADSDLDEALAALGWTRADLDRALPPRVGFAGAYHRVLAVRSRERLAALDYDYDRLGTLMGVRDWTTAQLVWREAADRFHARNPFPPGGVVEDPATGAAAAAFGAYLREIGTVQPPATVLILQGEDMGRPSRLRVDIHANRPEIAVTGVAVPIS